MGIFVVYVEIFASGLGLGLEKCREVLGLNGFAGENVDVMSRRRYDGVEGYC